MKNIRTVFLALAMAALSAASANLTAQSSGNDTNKLAGMVTDAAGQPIAGATVEYWHLAGDTFQPGELEMASHSTTAADGKFDFGTNAGFGYLIAHSSGLAPAWQSVGQPFDPQSSADHKLVLMPGGPLAGAVIDESNRPVANAEVFVSAAISKGSDASAAARYNILAGKPAERWLSTYTDEAGRFRIENLPTNATAVLAVRFSGKVLSQDKSFTDIESAGYSAGQLDIKLALEPAGSIEGKVVSSDTNQPPPVARLTLASDTQSGIFAGAQEPVKSGADGIYRFATVGAGSYHVYAFFGQNGSSEWVAEAPAVSVTAGQVSRDVQVRAQRGAMLEVLVTSSDNHKPMAKVNVTALRQSQQSAPGQSTSITDSNGLARLSLLPGDYQIMAFKQYVPAAQSPATVEAGKTNRVELEITGPKTIPGIVHQPDGSPAAGVRIQVIGGNGPRDADLKTDEQGKFVAEWNPRRFAGANEGTGCVLVRDADHNLAAAQDIDEDTTNLDLKLAPALTLAGHATCDGKPVTNVTAQLVFWVGRSGSWLQGLARTNTPGVYEIPALPPGRKYGIIISAPGYGQKQNHNLEIFAEPGRQELDTVELSPANLKLSGQVLDADDKPVPGCYVNLNGDNQPNAHTRTDHEGWFTFNEVCEGTVRIFANGHNLFGNASAQGGDTNVVLRLGQNSSSSPGARMHKLTGTVTDAEGKPVAGAQIAVFPSNDGLRWIKTGAVGEYHLNWSIEPWQAQNGSAQLVVRDLVRDLAATAELPDDATNLDVRLKPALTLTGVVKDAANAPLAGAEIGLWFKAGNTYESVVEHIPPTDAAGRFEIKCLPSDEKYIIWASAHGYGKSQVNVEGDSETNRLELEPFTLKLADREIAGQVLQDNDKPAAGVNVNLSGTGQPDGYMTTDSKGRFHFKVCEGEIRLFAYSPNGGAGNAQATVEAGDTNIVMTLSASSMAFRQSPRRAPLKGSALPDLAAVNLAADAAPANQAVLIGLFDASQRPSRHIVQVLAQKIEALRQRNITVLAVQSAAIADSTFNDWKTAVTVPFPIGRVTEKSEKTKWASEVTALPWLILADAKHQVVAEGFSAEEIEAQIQKLIE